MYTDKEEPKGYCKTNPHHPTKNHETHKYSRKPRPHAIKKKGFELRSSRADTPSAQGKARAINLIHIGSTPYYVSNAYATTMNIIELQEAERAEDPVPESFFFRCSGPGIFPDGHGSCHGTGDIPGRID